MEIKTKNKLDNCSEKQVTLTCKDARKIIVTSNKQGDSVYRSYQVTLPVFVNIMRDDLDECGELYVLEVSNGKYIFTTLTLENDYLYKPVKICKRLVTLPKGNYLKVIDTYLDILDKFNQEQNLKLKRGLIGIVTLEQSYDPINMQFEYELTIEVKVDVDPVFKQYFTQYVLNKRSRILSDLNRIIS